MNVEGGHFVQTVKDQTVAPCQHGHQQWSIGKHKGDFPKHRIGRKEETIENVASDDKVTEIKHEEAISFGHVRIDPQA